MRKYYLAILAIVALFVLPTTANAGIREELDAADAVEIKVMQRGYRAYDPTALCDQKSHSKFYCDFFGSRGDCFLSGKAWVRRPGYRVQIITIKKDCF